MFIGAAVTVTARDGSSTAVWSQDDANGAERVYLRRITRTGRMRAPMIVSPAGQDPVFYDVAVDDEGDAVVVWQVDAPYPVQEQIVARRVSRTGKRGPVVRVSNEAETSARPKVAVAPTGVATIVFDRGEPTNRGNTVVRRLRLNNTLGRPTYLPWAYGPLKPASSRSGHVAFVWTGPSCPWVGSCRAGASTWTTTGTVCWRGRCGPRVSSTASSAPGSSTATAASGDSGTSGEAVVPRRSRSHRRAGLA